MCLGSLHIGSGGGEWPARLLETLFAQLQHKYCCACCHASMLLPRNVHSMAMGVWSMFKDRTY